MSDVRLADVCFGGDLKEGLEFPIFRGVVGVLGVFETKLSASTESSSSSICVIVLMRLKNADGCGVPGL